MPNPVIVNDLVVRWRTLTATETATAQALIGDAWEELLARVPDIESRLDNGTLRPGLVVKTVVAAVKSVMLNIDEVSQESLGDYSYSRQSPTAKLFFTEDDIELLSPNPDLAGSAFNIYPSWDAP